MATATPGTNSYVTEAEATAYFADRFGFDKWVAETKKNEILISAAQQLDNMCYWDFLPGEPLVFEDPVPQKVKDAQCEIAYLIVDSQSVSTSSGDAIAKMKAGPVEMEFKATGEKNPLINNLIVNLLSEYGLCSGGGSTKIIPLKRG